MKQITIKNLRFEKPQCEWQVKIDRSSILGNPYYMKNESERNKVCEQYETHFYKKIKGYSTIIFGFPKKRCFALTQSKPDGAFSVGLSLIKSRKSQIVVFIEFGGMRDLGQLSALDSLSFNKALE